MKTGIPVLIALLGATFYVQAGEDVDEVRTIDPDGMVHVHCTRGDLSIIGWDRSEAQVTGKLDDLARNLQFEVQGDKTWIRVRMPDQNVNRGDGADLVIHLPHNVHLQVEAVSADIELENMTGRLAVRTVSGDVSATGLGDRIRINTTSGDVNLENGAGQVSIMTTSGDTTLKMAATHIQVDSVSGEIELELEGFDSVVTNTVSADLELSGRLNPAGLIESKSVNSAVELRLAAPVNARLDIRTGPGGEIDNELSDDAPRRLENRGMALDATLGSGNGRINIITINGEIQLERL